MQLLAKKISRLRDFKIDKYEDLNYFGSEKYKISFEKTMELRKENKVFILDVRTKEENEYVKFEFAKNISTDEIPDRLSEIPKDKTIVLF